MKFAVNTLDGGKSKDVELHDAVFGIEDIRADILHRMVRWQLAKRQAGTHSTLNRSDVNRTTQKSQKQKGSGGARHGSKNAPIFVGGGIAHGPHPHSHEHSLQKKVRQLALRHALSAKRKAGELIVLEDASLPEPKTAALKASLEKLGLKSALVIDGAEVDVNFALAARNLSRIDVLPLAGLNVYDVLRSRKLVLTRAAVEGIHARFADQVEA
jgi:large subunit ribosomal protein L4